MLSFQELVNFIVPSEKELYKAKMELYNNCSANKTIGKINTFKLGRQRTVNG